MKSIIKNAAIVTILLCFSCKEKDIVEKRETQYSILQKANWFLGRWENNSPEGNLSESWVKQNDSTFNGESYFVIENDTVFAESIQLEERKNQLLYVVTVPNQNEEKPVSFTLTKDSSNQLVFENPNHDFPNTIIYNKVGKDSLVAEISGMKDGKKASQLFKMIKTR